MRLLQPTGGVSRLCISCSSCKPCFCGCCSHSVPCMQASGSSRGCWHKSSTFNFHSLVPSGHLSRELPLAMRLRGAAISCSPSTHAPEVMTHASRLLSAQHERCTCNQPALRVSLSLRVAPRRDARAHACAHVTNALASRAPETKAQARARRERHAGTAHCRIIERRAYTVLAAPPHSAPPLALTHRGWCWHCAVLVLVVP